MAKRLLEGIPLNWGWTKHDLSRLHELVQISFEPVDSQPTGEVASPNEGYLYDSGKQPIHKLVISIRLDIPVSIASSST